MPTANRRKFVPSSIRMFLGQDYQNSELLIVDDGVDCIADIVPRLSNVRYIRIQPGRSLGQKRNLACQASRGEVILHWDDDDWYAAWRIGYQLKALTEAALDLCGVDRVLLVDPKLGRACEYIYRGMGVPWLCGSSLCYRRDFWQRHPFGDINEGEDTRFVATAVDARIAVLPNSRLLVARIHDGNTSRNRPYECWAAHPITVVQSVVGDDWEQIFGGKDGLPLQSYAPGKRNNGKLCSL